MRNAAIWWLVVGALVMGASMPTVFEVLLQTGRRLDAVIENSASANGTNTSLFDETLAGYKDDQFNAGTLFLKTNSNPYLYTDVANEDLGYCPNSMAFEAQIDHFPLKPGTLDLVYTLGGSAHTVTDDGKGRIDQRAATNNTGISMTDGSGPWDIQSGNIVPYTVRITTEVLTTKLLSYRDDGEGHIIDTTNYHTWANIDYATGIITLVSGSTPLSTTEGYAEVEYSYDWLRGSINYATGSLSLHFSLVNSNMVQADYSYGYTTFLPMILRVSNFTAANGRVDFLPDTLNVGTNKGDRYGVMSSRYPRWLLFSKLNEVLADIRDYVTDTDVLITALTNGYETLVDAEKRIVEVLAGKASTSDRAWTRLTRWQHVSGALRVESDLTGYTTLRIRALSPVTRVDGEIETVTLLGVPTLQAVEISDYYSVSWLAVATAARCVRWRLQQPGAETQLLTALLNQLMSDEVRERQKWRNTNPAALRMTVMEWPEQ